MKEKWMDNKWVMIITSLIILSPIFIGTLLYTQLPEQMAIHFNTNNEPDNWAPKALVVYGMPIALLALHWIVITFLLNDPKKQNINKKLLTFNMWIVPIITMVALGMTYITALNYKVDISLVASILIVVIFIGLGNYLPKARQNYTVGIKVPWTLDNEENWNKTHRLAGWCFVLSGLICLINIFLHFKLPIILVILILDLLVPIGFSFIYYLKTKNKK